MEKAPLMPVILGSEKIRNIKETIAERLIWILPDVANRIQKYLNDKLQIEKQLQKDYPYCQKQSSKNYFILFSKKMS